MGVLGGGLPGVSTGTGDIPAMLRDGKTGHLVPHEDPAAMAEAVAALLEDPEDALLMTRLARAEVERYTWPHVCPAWAEVYARRKG